MINPISRERFVWRNTAQSTNGEFCEFDLHLGEGAIVPAAHLHPLQQERFEVKTGSIRLTTAGQEELLGVGDVRTVAAGVVHTWGNAANGETVVAVRLTPALRSEAFFASFCKLARDGHANGKGMPRNPLRLAILAHEYRQVVRAPGALGSGPVMALLAVLARLGRGFGLRV
jgi:mannose-6-phosphate isomerase-like protein (cupin superfamily)